MTQPCTAATKPAVRPPKLQLWRREMSSSSRWRVRRYRTRWAPAAWLRASATSSRLARMCSLASTSTCCMAAAAAALAPARSTACAVAGTARPAELSVLLTRVMPNRDALGGLVPWLAQCSLAQRCCSAAWSGTLFWLCVRAVEDGAGNLLALLDDATLSHKHNEDLCGSCWTQLEARPCDPLHSFLGCCGSHALPAAYLERASHTVLHFGLCHSSPGLSLKSLPLVSGTA